MRTLTRPLTARCTMPLYISFLLSESHCPSACRLPVNYRLYDYSECKIKNDYFLDRLTEVMSWGLTPSSVTGDSWYSSTKNFKAIKNKGLGFMFALKSHWSVSLEKNVFMAVRSIEIPEEGLTVSLRDFGFIRGYFGRC